MKYLITALMLVVGILKSFGQQTWKLAKNEQGIKVYVGEILNSDYLAFKAVMSVKANENQILKTLKDVNKYIEWFAFTESVKLIKQTENEQFFAMETDYPWPFSNECMNYSMAFQRTDNKNMKIIITGTNDKVDCKYSLKKAGGYILLESDNQNVRITYYFHTEPSQNIPARLINPMIYRMPFQTFIALKKKLLH
jgi:uncharacterized protein YktA (UPF0223 family)